MSKLERFRVSEGKIIYMTEEEFAKSSQKQLNLVDSIMDDLGSSSDSESEPEVVYWPAEPRLEPQPKVEPEPVKEKGEHEDANYILDLDSGSVQEEEKSIGNDEDVDEWLDNIVFGEPLVTTNTFSLDDEDAYCNGFSDDSVDTVVAPEDVANSKLLDLEISSLTMTTKNEAEMTHDAPQPTIESSTPHSCHLKGTPPVYMIDSDDDDCTDMPVLSPPASDVSTEQDSNDDETNSSEISSQSDKDMSEDKERSCGSMSSENNEDEDDDMFFNVSRHYRPRREKQKPMWCKICDRFFKNIDELKEHIEDDHHQDASGVNEWNYATWDLEVSQVAFDSLKPSSDDEED